MDLEKSTDLVFTCIRNKTDPNENADSEDQLLKMHVRGRFSSCGQ